MLMRENNIGGTWWIFIIRKKIISQLVRWEEPLNLKSPIGLILDYPYRCWQISSGS